MNTISKYRREALRQFTQEAQAESRHYLVVSPDELDALLNKADELDAIKAGPRWDAARQRTRASFDRFWSAYQEGDELDFVPVDQPHAPTVAAALREVGLCMAEQDFDADTLFQRAAEIGEGRENG